MVSNDTGLRVEQVMTPAPVHLNEGCTLGGTLGFLLRHRYQAAPVVDGAGQLAGMVTRAGLLARLSQLIHQPSASGEVMRATIGTLLERPLQVSVGTPLSDACKLLVCEEASAALVVGGGRVVGIVTLLDVARAVAFGGARAPAFGEGRGHCFSPGGLPESLAGADAAERARLARLLAPAEGDRVQVDG